MSDTPPSAMVKMTCVTIATTNQKVIDFLQRHDDLTSKVEDVQEHLLLSGMMEKNIRNLNEAIAHPAIFATDREALKLALRATENTRNKFDEYLRQRISTN